MESDGKMAKDHPQSLRELLSASVVSDVYSRLETYSFIVHGGVPSNSECWKAKIDSNKIIWEQLESSGEDRRSHSSETIASHVIFIGGNGCKSTLA